MQLPLVGLINTAASLEDAPIEPWLSLIERCIREGGEEQVRITEEGVRFPTLSTSKDDPLTPLT